MKDDGMRSWRRAAVVALGVIVVSVPLYVARESQRDVADSPAAETVAGFVGREKCVDCHEGAYELEHDGITSRFYRKDDGYFVFTEGTGGEMAEFEVLYTFGIEPLQQYLVSFPGGRLQALSVAWDTEENRWFDLYPKSTFSPDDWLHWTRNGQNWNGMCAECHSTNLKKNYDAATSSFDTTWSEIDVSCEACHGPASLHLAWAEVDPAARPEIKDYGLVVNTGGLDSRQQVDLCAPCHSRRSEFGDYDHTQTHFLDAHLPSLLAEGTYHVDGQILEEDYVWGSFVQSKMYQSGVWCSDCHDAHSLALHKEGNDLCLQCHQAATYDAYEHHFHQKTVEGQPSDGALCVKCHMPEQPFMVIDDRADHSIRVPRPDLTRQLGVPNACGQSGCHDDQTVDWSVDAFTQWYGTTRRPHFGTVLAAARSGDSDAVEGLILLAEDPLYPAIVRATALHALQAFPGPQAFGVVQRALADDEPLLRVTAVEVVAADGPEQMVELLAPLLFDSVRVVRLRTAARLNAVGREYFTHDQRQTLTKELDDFIDTMKASLDFAASGLTLGNLYEEQRDATQAERFYRTALEVDDLFFPAKVNLAILLSQQGRISESEQLLREVLEAYPDQYDSSYSLALLLVGEGRSDEALPYLARAAGGLPQRARVHYNYGLLLAQLDNPQEAESALITARDLEPQNIDYLFALVDFYFKRGQLDAALEHAQRIISAHPQNRLGYELKASIEASRR
jgi:tetratricopeptide (TPR) repeat protein